MKDSKSTKNFSWIMKVIDTDGKIRCFNVTDTARGYRQGWYKTAKSAMKALQYAINCEKHHANREIIEAYCFTRSGERF